MKERLIICEIVTGSHLYGTNRPDSDEDFTGVFVPGTEDMFSLQRCPMEWSLNEKKSDGERNTVGDVDRKFYSLQRFLQLAGEGQPGQLELLFAPDSATITTSPVWELIKANRHLFLSKKSIAPFVGFALSQAHKAVIKGQNLNLIRDILKWGAQLTNEERNKPLAEVAQFFITDLDDKRYLVFGDVEIAAQIVVNSHGFQTVEVGGRNYDTNLKTKKFIENLSALESRYGSRAKAAAETTYDYKSLMHAYRMLFEAKELLSTGLITLPRPETEVRMLKNLLALGQLSAVVPDELDHFAALTGYIDELRQEIEPASELPEEPNWKQINALCSKILKEYLL